MEQVTVRDAERRILLRINEWICQMKYVEDNEMIKMISYLYLHRQLQLRKLIRVSINAKDGVVVRPLFSV